MSKIDHLTKAQRERLPAYRQRWIEAALATTPIDRAAVEQAIAGLYRMVGVPLPAIHWCGGPRKAVQHFLDGPVKPGEPLAERIRIVTTGDTLPDLAPDVWSEMAFTLRAPVSSTVVDRVAEPFFDRLNLDLGERIARRSIVGGLFDAHNAAFYDFARSELGLAEETEAYAQLAELARQVGWVMPFRNACYVAERPTRLERNESGRLHSADDAAIAFPDGYLLYAWKGIFVPARLILEPGRITAKLINAERNAELRRCMIERLGSERYLKDSGANLVGEDTTGRLWRKEFASGDAWSVVEVVNGTEEADGSRKRYFLQVPPRCRTAREAVAWTYGLTEHEYVVAIRT